VNERALRWLDLANMGARTVVIRLISPTNRMQRTMLNLKVPDMMCGRCAGTVEKAVKSVDLDASVAVDLASKIVTVKTSAGLADVSAAIDRAGYANEAA
jgi:copper chaperone